MILFPWRNSSDEFLDMSNQLEHGAELNNCIPFDDSPSKRGRPILMQQVRRSHTPLKGGLARAAELSENTREIVCSGYSSMIST